MNLHSDNATTDMKSTSIEDDTLHLRDNCTTDEIYDFTSCDNNLDSSGESYIPDSAATRHSDESNSLYPQDYYEPIGFYESVSLGGTFSNCDKHSTCDNNTDCKDWHYNAETVHVKEELIIDSIESPEEYDYNENSIPGSQSNCSVNIIAQTLASNENILVDEEITHNNGIFNIQISEENINDRILFSQYDERSNVNVAKSLKGKQKNNATMKLLRMYCQTCSRSSKHVNLRGQNCFKCKRPMQFYCAKCKTKFRYYSSAYPHIKYKCSNKSYFKCSKCKYKTWDKRSLQSHTKHRHGSNQCVSCGVKCKNYPKLKKHQLYECKFKTRRGRKQKLDVYSFMEYVCKSCNKIVSKGKRLYIHQCSECNQDIQMRCTKCKHQCNSRISAYYHLKYKCERTDLYCNECDYKTPYRVSILNHIQNNHMPRKCDKCGEEFNDKMSLRIHKKSHKHTLKRRVKSTKKVKHEFIDMYCTTCDKAFNKEYYEILTNCQECSSLLLYRCKACTNKFKNYTGAYAHVKYNCEKGNLIKCSMCEISTPLQRLRKHIRETHTMQSCKNCSVKCENYSGLKQHLSYECIFRKDAPVKCSVCDLTTTNKGLEKHVKYQHTACDCPKCGMKLTSLSVLKQHLSDECSFRPDAPINCSLCDFSTTNRYLEKHVKFQHTACDCPKCGMKIASYGVLSQHLSYECSLRQDAPVKCSLCDYLTTNRDVEKHMKFEHTECECSKCGLKCANYSVLKQHQSFECSFRQDVPVNCSLCDYLTTTKDLEKHMKFRHTACDCSKCGMKCANYSLLKQHQSYECSFRKDDRVKCSMCDYSTSKRNLAIHTRFHHTACDCQMCGIKCASSADLKHHLSHECKFKIGTRVTCPTCNMSVVRKNLNKHIVNQHTLIDANCEILGENGSPFIKCLECGSLFTNSKSLKQHVKLNHTISTCPKCYLQCDNFYCMKRHQLYECIYRNQEKNPSNGTVYDMNVYCPNCDVTAKLIYGLKATTCSICKHLLKFQCGTCKGLHKKVTYLADHIKYICNKEPSYCCSQCDFKAKRQSKLTQHIKKCHAVDDVQNSSQTVEASSISFVQEK